MKIKKNRIVFNGSFLLELLSRLELPNLFLTKEALYRLSYNSISCFPGGFRRELYITIYLRKCQYPR